MNRGQTDGHQPGVDDAAFEDHLSALDNLAAIAELASVCTRCGLSEGRTQVVFGEGSPVARLILVGEGPGANEDRQGRPFVGRAGMLLDQILTAADFARQDVYITNVVKCRPPSNRQPADQELQACMPYLLAQLRLIGPSIMVCMGATAAKALLDPQARITQIRGRWHRRWGIDIMPTFHPAALLRDPSKKRPVWEDFKAVRRLYQQMQEPGA